MTIRTRRHQQLLATVVALAAVLALVLVSVPSVTTGGGKRASTVGDTPFSPTSIWNRPLPADAPLAADSGALVAQLEHQIATGGTWINSFQYSTPIYTAGPGARRVPVVLDQATRSASSRELASAFASGVPLPATATAAPGSDADMVVWQPSSDTLWEMWLSHKLNGIWHAMWGGRMEHVSANPGYFTSPPDWGTAATSLSLLGGTIRISDLRSGRINHALSISIPEARTGVYASPAERTDGKLNSPAAIPEGTRFRLDPRLNLGRLQLPRVTLMLARAAQRYGLFVRDQGANVAFYAQQPSTPGSDPYYGAHGLFGGQNPKQITQAFPWSHLEAVSAPLHGAG
jgi:hypothetical protein